MSYDIHNGNNGNGAAAAAAAAAVAATTTTKAAFSIRTTFIRVMGLLMGCSIVFLIIASYSHYYTIDNVLVYDSNGGVMDSDLQDLFIRDDDINIINNISDVNDNYSDGDRDADGSDDDGDGDGDADGDAGAGGDDDADADADADVDADGDSDGDTDVDDYEPKADEVTYASVSLKRCGGWPRPPFLKADVPLNVGSSIPTEKNRGVGLIKHETAMSEAMGIDNIDIWPIIIRESTFTSIRHIVRATIYASCGCGVRFFATMRAPEKYAHVRGINERLEFDVVVKSVDAGTDHFEGESHLREIKSYYLDRILGTFTVPPVTGIRIPVSALRSAKFIDQTEGTDSILDATACFRIEADVIDAAVSLMLGNVTTAPLNSAIEAGNTLWNVPHYIVFAYLSMCLKNGHSHFATGVVHISIDNDRCMLPNSVVFNPILPKKQRKMITLWQLEIERMCNLPAAVIDVARKSTLKGELSIGKQLQKFLATDPLSVDLLVHQSEFYDDLNRRVKDLLKHEQLCKSSNRGLKALSDEEIVQKSYHFDDETRRLLRHGSLKLLERNRTHKGQILDLYIEGAGKVSGKIIGGKPETRIKSWTDQGWSEVAAYHIAKLIGIYIPFTVASRRIPLKELEQAPGNSNYSLNKKLEYKSFTDLLHRRKSIIQGSPPDDYIDISLTSWVDYLHVNSPPPMEWRSIFNQSRIIKNETEACAIGEVSDILLFDYLIHNFDRYSPKNFVMANGHWIPFDNGLGWWKTPTDNCEYFFRCPPIFYPRGKNGGIGATDMDKNYCEKICAPTGPTGPKDRCCPYNSRNFCVFRRTTIIRLRRIGPKNPKNKRLSSLLKESLVNEEVQPIFPERYGTQDEFYGGIEDRLNTFLKYVDECIESFGEDRVLIH